MHPEDLQHHLAIPILNTLFFHKYRSYCLFLQKVLWCSHLHWYKRHHKFLNSLHDKNHMYVLNQVRKVHLPVLLLIFICKNLLSWFVEIPIPKIRNHLWSTWSEINNHWNQNRYSQKLNWIFRYQRICQ